MSFYVMLSTLSESGRKVLRERPGWIRKVNADVERILAMPDVKEKGVTLGYRYVGGSPEKLDAFLKHEIAKWAEVAQSASLK